jgi:hypothetical protein
MGGHFEPPAILFAPFATTLWRHLCKLGNLHCCQAKAHSDHTAFHAVIAAAESKTVSKYEIRRSRLICLFLKIRDQRCQYVTDTSRKQRFADAFQCLELGVWI